MKLDQLPWIGIAPYDQILTDLINSCLTEDMSLICVEGSEGSGKTRLLSELLVALSVDETVGLIEFRGRTNQVFYHNIKALTSFLKLDPSQIFCNFLLALEKILEEKRHVYVLIDDADDIEYEIFKALLSIINDNFDLHHRVTLVLFMGATPMNLEFQPLLQQAKRFSLTGMTVAQTKSFIDQIYLKTPEKSVSIFEANQLNSLSYGYPGRLIKLLQNKKEKTIEPKRNNIYTLLTVFIIALSIVLTLYQWIFNSEQSQKVSIDPKINHQPTVIKKEVVPVKTITVMPATEIVLDETNNFFEADIVNPEKIVKLQKNENSSIESNLILNAEDKKTLFNYVIELGRNRSKTELEKILKGRSIPGKVQFKQLDNAGLKIWVAYLGPYGSEKQATQGMSKLPASLQSLPLKVNKEF